MVGPLTAASRAEKVQRYLEKRKRRSWKKRIAYECRKRVADNRIRVKGRFVSKKSLEIEQSAGAQVLNN
jgi:hypothetical protein